MQQQLSAGPRPAAQLHLPGGAEGEFTVHVSYDAALAFRWCIIIPSHYPDGRDNARMQSPTHITLCDVSITSRAQV